MGSELNPIVTALIFVGMAVVPFALLAMTSFIKLSVVFGILRSAIGAQQIPSGAVTALLSLALTAYVMLPVGRNVGEVLSAELQKKPLAAEGGEISRVVEVASAAAVPLEDFIRSHSHTRERLFFAEAHLTPQQRETEQARVLCPSGDAECVPRGETFFTLVPSFILSELKEAFAIGFAIFLPFLVVDLVIANLLVGLGMMMVSPVTVSLPFKIILFVLADGWFLLTKGLVLGYQ